MEFRVLGPVEIRAAGRVLPAGRARRRSLLAVLLLEAGRAVPADRLIERAWDERPSAAARNTLYAYIARLRAAMASAGERGSSLTRQQDGYLLRAGRDSLDLFRFRALVSDAAAGGGSRADLLGEALALWRGRALCGLDSPWLNTMRAALELERHAVMLDLNDIRLQQGQHAALIGDLTSQAAAAPGDERLAGQLMLALGRAGAQAAALRAYDQLRWHLAREPGTEPGPQLQALRERIARSGPELTAAAPLTLAVPGLAVAGPPGAQPPDPWPAAGVPRQLPAAADGFTGRDAELAALAAAAGQATAGRPGTVAITAISGSPGVGKTALALWSAHQVAAQFPDGQLYADLRGFDPSGRPASPAEVVGGFLDALGMPREPIPVSPGAQAGLYRSLLSGRRMLIVLDNARDEQQVRPLLPASPGILVLVTSRSQLSGLAASYGARLLNLDVLSHAEAVQLLTARLGARRAAADPAAVADIARLCAHLPLALALAAARAAARPAFPLAALAAELAGSAGRLDALEPGDPAVSLRAVFSWSTGQLAEDSARLFRLLGLHPGPDISVPAAASLAGASQPETRRLLADLAGAHLVTEPVPGRFAVHDLLRDYAAEQVHSRDTAGEHDAAIGRVLDHYLHTSARAAQLVDLTTEPVELRPPRPGAVLTPLADFRQALAWFEAEHQVLFAAVALVEAGGLDSYAWQLPWAMAAGMNVRGYWVQNAAILRTALDGATRQGAPAAIALSGRMLAMVFVELGDFGRAAQHLSRSLALYRKLGNRFGEGHVHLGLGTLAHRQDRPAEALEHAEEALRLFRVAGNKTSVAEALNDAGWFHCVLGHHQQAAEYCRQALAAVTETRNVLLEGTIWDSMGFAEHHAGNLAAAADCYQRALSLCRQTGDRVTEAIVLIHSGDTCAAAGEPGRAARAWRQALAIYEELRSPKADELRARLDGALAAAG